MENKSMFIYIYSHLLSLTWLWHKARSMGHPVRIELTNENVVGKPNQLIISRRFKTKGNLIWQRATSSSQALNEERTHYFVIINLQE